MDAAQQEFRIVELPAWTALGLMLDCPGFDASGIGDLWMKLGTITKGHDLHDGVFGISLPLPDGAAGFRYWAVMKARDDTPRPAELLSLEMPAARFAVWPFNDTPDQMPVVFGDIYNNRLKAAGLQSPAAWTSMEHYPPDWHDEASGRFRCDLYAAII